MPVLTKKYSRPRFTPLFPSWKPEGSEYTVTPCKNGFGGYFKLTAGRYGQKNWGTLTEAFGGQLVGSFRVYIHQDSYFGTDYQDFYPCLAYFGKRIWTGWTMGDGMIASFDGTSFECGNLNEDQTHNLYEEALKDALAQAEVACESRQEEEDNITEDDD